MSETPSVTPALTDEHVDAATFSIREHTEHCPTSWINENDFDTWLAAVVARAKREARDDMANDLALLIDQECPHEPDEHAEGTCEVCDYAFAMAQMVRDYAEAANDDHA